jgi:outer membrane protein assembly factor BamE
MSATAKMIRFTTLLLIALAGLGLGACSVHKIDVQQGNVITQEVLNKLTVGMDKGQVKRLLGTPLIEDPFHNNRWDYVYRFKAGNTKEQQSAHLTLLFEDDRLQKIDVIKAPPKEAEIKKPALTRR